MKKILICLLCVLQIAMCLPCDIFIAVLAADTEAEQIAGAVETATASAIDTNFWPGYVRKALTISYDDGRPANDKWMVDFFNEQGIRATFNLLTKYYTTQETKDEVVKLYEGHEIANHTRNHYYYAEKKDDGSYVYSDDDAKADIDGGKSDLEAMFGKGSILGFVWPGGDPKREALTQYLKDTGVEYARPVSATGGFDLPNDMYNWQPTCHHSKLPQKGEEFFSLSDDGEMKLFYLWGHNYEFNEKNPDKGYISTEVVKDFVLKAKTEKVYIATNIEICRYINAVRGLVIDETEKTITNNSGVDVYARVDYKNVIIPAGGSVEYSGESVLGESAEVRDGSLMINNGMTVSEAKEYVSGQLAEGATVCGIAAENGTAYKGEGEYVDDGDCVIVNPSGEDAVLLKIRLNSTYFSDDFSAGFDRNKYTWFRISTSVEEDSYGNYLKIGRTGSEPERDRYIIPVLSSQIESDFTAEGMFFLSGDEDVYIRLTGLNGQASYSRIYKVSSYDTAEKQIIKPGWNKLAFEVKIGKAETAFYVNGVKAASVTYKFDSVNEVRYAITPDSNGIDVGLDDLKIYKGSYNQKNDSTSIESTTYTVENGLIHIPTETAAGVFVSNVTVDGSLKVYTDKTMSYEVSGDVEDGNVVKVTAKNGRYSKLYTVRQDDLIPEDERIAFKDMYLTNGTLSAIYRTDKKTPQGMVLILAVYGKDGKLRCTASANEVVYPDGETQKGTITVTLENNDIEQGMYARAYAFESANNIKPLCGVKTLTTNPNTVDVNFYPGYVKKAATFSYDDGYIDCDKPLIEVFNKYGYPCTFNLNSANFNTTDKKSEALAAYKGHEIANHVKGHPKWVETDENGDYKISSEDAIKAIDEGKSELEEIFGNGTVQGFAWPYNYTGREDLVEYVASSGVKYARSPRYKTDFSLPVKWLDWEATCHHRDLVTMKEKFYAADTADGLKLFYIWGHAAEFIKDNNMYVMDDFLSELKQRCDTWVGSNIDVYNYVNAINNLTVGENSVTNNSDTTVYIEVNCNKVELLPNATYNF